MSERKKKVLDVELEKSKKQFEKIVRICIIAGIIVTSSFIIYYLINPSPGYVTFGILNSNKEAENYQTQATTGENIDFYVTVDNYLGVDLTFQLKIYKGDNSTQLSSSGSNNVEFNQSTDKVTLQTNEKWISDKLTISFFQLGYNQTIIVELWQYVDATTEEFYDILWLRMNITA